jgi:NADH-quinone oxidoreductase subunit E
MPSSKRKQRVKDTQIQQKMGQILDKYQRDPSWLVSILQDVQAEYYYLSENAIEEVSRGLGIPLTRVYSVATFFKAFSLIPRGRHLINVCLGTACHVRGAPRVLEKIERDLGISSGETTKDLRFTLETVNCVGACALGPMIIIDGEYHGQMSTDRVSPVLKNYA